MRIPCDGITIGFDHPDCDLPFISHAHSDHVARLKKQARVISSLETLDLADMASEIAHVKGTKLLGAGHILGARQLVVDGNDERVVYTGDFCLKPNIFGFKAEIPECDRLIMEATYGNPDYVFPPLEEVHQQISQWVNNNRSSNLLIGCYELGKAQEIVKILNESSIAPIVTEKTNHFCSVYEKYGIKLDRILVGSDEAEEEMSHPFVALVPMAKAKRYFAHKMAQAFERDTLCAVATGWALHYRFNADAAFPLSDHADFNDLVHFVEHTGAKKVEFFCGDGTKVLEKAKQKNEAILNS
jgi:putative mRNA 3-end processing factor